MGDLTSYRISDFILFSESAYYRQFEIYNQSMWPLHILVALLACLLIYSMWQKQAWAGRATAAVLVLSWLWVSYAFLYQRFYLIHVVAHWYALAFVLQACLIAWYGLVKNSFSLSVDISLARIGKFLVLSGVILYPLMAPLAGRPWQQSEMFALAPDPTVVVTLGLLLLYRASAVLFLLPIIWLVISYTTQASM